MGKRKNTPVTVYLIHFEEPYVRVQHYLGSAEDLEARLGEHRATTWERYEDAPITLPDGRRKNGRSHGNGATLLGAVNSAGISWKLARTWEGVERAVEGAIKGRKNNKCLCPACSGQAAYRNARTFKPAEGERS